MEFELVFGALRRQPTYMPRRVRGKGPVDREETTRRYQPQTPTIRTVVASLIRQAAALFPA